MDMLFLMKFYFVTVSPFVVSILGKRLFVVSLVFTSFFRFRSTIAFILGGSKHTLIFRGTGSGANLLIGIIYFFRLLHTVKIGQKIEDEVLKL